MVSLHITWKHNVFANLCGSNANVEVFLHTLPCTADGGLGWPCILVGHLEIPMGVLPLLA